MRVLNILSAIGFSLIGSGLAAAADPGGHSGHDLKCGTPAVLEMLGKRGKIAARMNLTCATISDAGHFRVHYDTAGYNAPAQDDRDRNGIPDYVDSTLVYLEYAWDLQVNQLGYQPPLSDNGAGGGDEVDVYIKEYGNYGYAVTYPDQFFNGTSSAYIIIDNNYREDQYESKGFDALKVTTAHEFFHAIQFGYRLELNQLIWWMEQSATWMEDRAWDDVNDYLAYLQHYFSNANKLPLDTGSAGGQYMYGAVVWPMYLARKFGDDIIRSAWEALAVAKYPRITVFDTIIPGGLNAALNEFGVWNYFTRERASNGHFYPDGRLFGHTVGIDLFENMHPAQDSLRTRNLTSNYVEFLFLGEWGAKDALRIDTAVSGGRHHESSLIFYNDPDDFRIHRIESPDAAVALGKTWSRAILVTTCVNPLETDGRFSFTADWEPVTAVGDRPPATFAFRGAFPNPFNPSTAIRFTLPGNGKVHIRIYDILGRKAADLFEGELAAGEKRILWKPTDLAGGVYFVHIATPFGSRTQKVLFLK